MNNIYLSLEPIREHFRAFNDPEGMKRYIEQFIESNNGCYCHKVGKIVLNTKNILEGEEEVGMIIDHEVTHHILQKYFGRAASKWWDKIYEIIEKYIWGVSI